MRKITIFIFFSLLISCQKSKPFFDFDEAYLYQITNKESDKYFSSDNNTKQVEKDEFKKIAFFNTSPTNLNDKWFFEKIEKYYPKKQKIEEGKLNELSDIFSERNEKKAEFTNCFPIYRNIFIFKKNGKVVGISKICFDCLMEHTIGAKRNTKNFGSDNEYERLMKLVNWNDSR
jgi:hypothetical protein